MGFGLVAAAVVGGRELHRDGQCQHPVRPNKARARLLPASQMLPQLASLSTHVAASQAAEARLR